MRSHRFIDLVHKACNNDILLFNVCTFTCYVINRKKKSMPDLRSLRVLEVKQRQSLAKNILAPKYVDITVCR